MSLTPASTAEMAMKSAWNASAMSRASVVLPDPGGPHRIIECGLPEAKATASGFPGSSRWRCAMTAPSVFGRKRSASGVAGFSTAKRSVADDIGALRRRELEKIRRELRIALELGELDARLLTEVVEDVQRGERRAVETQPDLGEARFLVLRSRAQPVEPVGSGQLLSFESALDVV